MRWTSLGGVASARWVWPPRYIALPRRPITPAPGGDSSGGRSLLGRGAALHRPVTHSDMARAAGITAAITLALLGVLALGAGERAGPGSRAGVGSRGAGPGVAGGTGGRGAGPKTKTRPLPCCSPLPAVYCGPGRGRSGVRNPRQRNDRDSAGSTEAGQSPYGAGYGVGSRGRFPESLAAPGPPTPCIHPDGTVPMTSLSVSLARPGEDRVLGFLSAQGGARGGDL